MVHAFLESIHPKVNLIARLGFELTHYNVADDGGARVVMVIVVGNRHGDTSSNPERD